MPACEKCWRDAGEAAHFRGGDKVKHYEEFVGTRNCTPEEQAGEFATQCADCGRVACHPYVKACMACGWVPGATPDETDGRAVE